VGGIPRDRPGVAERSRRQRSSIRGHARLQAAARERARHHGGARRDHDHGAPHADHWIPARARSRGAGAARSARRDPRRIANLHRRHHGLPQRAGVARRCAARGGRHRARRPGRHLSRPAARRTSGASALPGAEFSESNRAADRTRQAPRAARMGGAPRRADRRGRSVLRSTMSGRFAPTTAPAASST
jgi:hypothetical protein